MSLHSILDALRAVAPLRRAGFRPRLELLDDRSLPSFSPAVPYGVGDNPHAVAIGHFNEDVHLDLVTANYFSSTVSVLLGNGNGTFQSALTTDAGVNPTSLAVGDFNDDGKMDLAMVNGYDYYGYVSTMLGNGNGTFQPPSTVNLDPGAKPTSVATGDFNEDGTMDLAVTSNVDPYYPGDVYTDFGLASVLLSAGDGTFLAPSSNALSNVTNSVVVEDFNGDGHQDLVVGTYNLDEVVRVSLGDGQGNHSLQSPNWSFRHGRSMAAGDVDGDGDKDLVSANGFDVRVRLGNGLGGFDAPTGGVSYTAGSQPSSVVLGDFNNDNLLDIATANFGSHDVSILRGKGGGVFWHPENFAAGPGAIAISAGDLDGDGWRDVATANVSGDSASVLINDRNWSTPPMPLVSVGDTSVTEGNTGTVNATFTLTLLYATNVDVTVRYETSNISAEAGSDYVAASGTVTIPAGQTTGTFTVTVLGDYDFEPSETFAVNLSNPSGATIGDGKGVGTILDNEPRISINNVSKKEGNNGKTTNFTFTVRLTFPSDQSITVNYATSDGTATADSDYVSKSGTVTFAPGQTTQTITIAVLGDRVREPNETFAVNLTTASQVSKAIQVS